MLESSQDLNLAKSSLTIRLVFKGRDLLYRNLRFCHMIKCRSVGKTSNITNWL